MEDLDEVDDAYTDRLLDMQIEEGLPIYVVPIWPPARVAAYLRERARAMTEERLPVVLPQTG